MKGTVDKTVGGVFSGGRSPGGIVGDIIGGRSSGGERFAGMIAGGEIPAVETGFGTIGTE